MLDLIHRIYEADESFKSLDFMVHSRLYFSQIVLQIVAGTLVPLLVLSLAQVMRFSDKTRKLMYTSASVLILVGIFAMRWNVVIGGQLFSKSFLGYTTYKMEFAHREGLLPAIVLMVLPFVILWGLLKLLPPWSNLQPAASVSYGESLSGGVVVTDPATEPDHRGTAAAGVGAGADDRRGTHFRA
jgi:Ni/Fe-hydrogenase subunit HybB-like protein